MVWTGADNTTQPDLGGPQYPGPQYPGPPQYPVPQDPAAMYLFQPNITVQQPVPRPGQVYQTSQGEGYQLGQVYHPGPGEVYQPEQGRQVYQFRPSHQHHLLRWRPGAEHHGPVQECRLPILKEGSIYNM